jgi:hypothetical protein
MTSNGGPRCSGCAKWTTERCSIYESGDQITNYQAPPGRGSCSALGIETPEEFGCVAHAPGEDHVERTPRTGAPHHHWIMIPCPDCRGGKTDPGGRGHRCAGTGLVRLYDDGYVGDEQTRTHPKDRPQPATCGGCGGVTEPAWVACPHCGHRLKLPVAETENVALDFAPVNETVQ